MLVTSASDKRFRSKPTSSEYLSALKIHGLAECEGMKQFLEKHNAITESGDNGQGGFARLGKAWPNPQALAKVGGECWMRWLKRHRGLQKAEKRSLAEYLRRCWY